MVSSAVNQHQAEILSALAMSAESLERGGRVAEWVLLRTGGGGFGLKPDLSPTSLCPSEADVLDLESQGYLHRLTSTSDTVIAKFAFD